MKSERINIMDLEIDDIIFVNNEHGYCTVKDIAFVFTGGIMLTLEHCELWRGNRKGNILFNKQYKLGKTFKLFQ